MQVDYDYSPGMKNKTLLVSSHSPGLNKQMTDIREPAKRNTTDSFALSSANEVDEDQELSQLSEGYKLDPETGEKVKMSDFEMKIEKLKTELTDLKRRETNLESEKKIFPIDYVPPPSEFEVSSNDSLIGDEDAEEAKMEGHNESVLGVQQLDVTTDGATDSNLFDTSKMTVSKEAVSRSRESALKIQKSDPSVESGSKVNFGDQEPNLEI